MKSKNLLRTVISSSESRNFLIQGHFKDSSLSYIFKKFERIMLAIYLLTAHIENNESIKHKVRNLSTEILLSLSKTSHSDEGIRVIFLRESLSSIVTLQSMIGTMVVSGLIKETSYALVAIEIESIVANIFEKTKGADGLIHLKEEIFSIKNFEESYERGHVGEDNGFKGQKINSINKVESSVENKTKGHEVEKTPLNNKSIELEDRKKTIIDFFKEKDKMTLKDISVLLPQYGEKTIQRELLFLVSRGVLGRVGKKRWTQYFLNK